jgi:NADH dehydrogenase
VVATGSVMRRPPVAGASEAYSIDTVRDAVELDHRLMEISRRQQATIAIVGAGFTGIELALEMRDRLAWYKPDRAQTARVVLLDRSSVVGPELGPGPRPFIISALEQASVETRLEQRITALGRDWVLFESGERLQADAVVVCTGLVAAPFTASVPGPKDALGRILVDKTLRSPLEGIFAAGDACAADAGDGHVTLLSCQHALQLGRFAGENAARSLTGLPLLRYQQPDYVTCLDLGRSGAVFTRGWNRAVGTAGAEAKALKREINTIRIYPPTGSRDSLLDASQIGGRSALSDAA